MHRFLADAGVVKPLTKNNPEKAKPKKKAQERAAANAPKPAEGEAPAAWMCRATSFLASSSARAGFPASCG